MPYYQLNPDVQFNFQINRILTYGHETGDFQEIKDVASRIKDFDSWYHNWVSLAEKAEEEKRYLHAAYYYRLAEFFLTDDRREKGQCYRKFKEDFYRGIGEVVFEQHQIPYKGTHLPALRFNTSGDKATVVVHGGYDSFIEEFYPAVKDFPSKGYSLILFEGPGQGEALRNGLKFTHQWEKPVGAVLDYFGLEGVPLVGISWGGFLCLRAAAFEPRISKVVSYDVLYDGLDLLLNQMPLLLRLIFKGLLACDGRRILNGMTQRLRSKSVVLDWAVSHGMHITGASTPFEFYKNVSKHTMKVIAQKVTQDVLLLAGERDHYIPLNHLFKLQRELTGVRSLTARIFTEREGGEQHCQVGNHQLALEEIIHWLDKFYD